MKATKETILKYISIYICRILVTRTQEKDSSSSRISSRTDGKKKKKSRHFPGAHMALHTQNIMLGLLCHWIPRGTGVYLSDPEKLWNPEVLQVSTMTH